MAVNRKPKLRVVGGDLRPPQHRVAYGQWPNSTLVQFWSELEWSQLADWERPELSKTAWFPGVGFMTQRRPESEDEHNEVRDEYSLACSQAHSQRDLIEM